MIEISAKEWKFVGLLSLIIIIVTFLPNLVGLITTPKDSIFLGVQTINSGDTPVYYSWIEQAKEGHLLFINLYTAEDQARYIFDPFWLGVGLFAKAFSFSSFAAYQLVRVFLIPVFLGLAYIFISYFFKEEIKRKICFVFLSFASGVGGFVSLGTEFGFYNFWPPSMDTWVSEAITFFTLYHSPHFLASLTLTILIFLLILLAFEKQKIIYSFFAGLTALIFFQFHPYYVPTIFGVIGVFIVVQSLRSSKIRWDLIKHYLILILISTPAIFYHLWTLNNFWSRQMHAMQNNLITPPFYNLILTYGFLFVLSLFGVIFLLKTRGDKNVFLLSWWGIQWFLPYLPFLNYQRKMIEGFHVVIVIIAVFGLFYLKDILERKNFFRIYFLENKIILVSLFIFLFTFSNYYILMRDLDFYLCHNPAAFLNKEKEAAMIWLKENTPQDSIIFSTYNNGNLIPAFAVRTVYLGHWGMTASVGDKLEQTQQFFGKYNDKARAAFLKVSKIDYLFYGPEEKEFKNFNPEKADYLKNVYQNSEVTIYKVTD
jgi:hypothetical protein